MFKKKKICKITISYDGLGSLGTQLTNLYLNTKNRQIQQCGYVVIPYNYFKS